MNNGIEFMKVLIVSRIYPDEYGFQGGIFIHNQARVLKNKGINVAVLFLDYRSLRKKRPFGFSIYNLDDIEVFRVAIPCGPFGLLTNTAFPMIDSIFARFVFSKWGVPDILHAHCWNSGIDAKRISQGWKIPYVITEHGSDVLMHKLNCIEKKKACAVYRDAQTVICVSNKLKQSLRAYSDREVLVIPNVIPDYMKITCNNIDKSNSSFRFVTVCNLVESKRVDLIIKSLAVLSKDFDNLELWIVGDGKQDKYLRELVAATTNSKNIVFLGRLANSQLPQIYAKCDCFVLASNYETFGVVYIEAMACGLPVIATKCGGPEEFVNETNGIMIDINNEEELSFAMREMLNAKNRYNSDIISSNVINKFGGRAVGEKLLFIYKNVKESDK